MMHQDLLLFWLHPLTAHNAVPLPLLRYLEGLAKAGGRRGEIARKKVAVLRSKAMVAAEAVATKFEEEAQIRVSVGRCGGSV